MDGRFLTREETAARRKSLPKELEEQAHMAQAESEQRRAREAEPPSEEQMQLPRDGAK